ncbi:MAG: twin-arginine translocation signal domain-containing protein [Myxococcales bacterium]|nr:twin-arginine translocation signal domain-containing protein [Myxococcales bacterium]
MIDQRIKNLSGNSRRGFLKFASAVGAAFTLDRSEVLNVIADGGGHALADEAACAKRNRTIHVVAGNGGFAWFQLLWPHTEIAKAGNDNFAFHAPGQAKDASDTDRPFVYAPDSPWQSMSRLRRISAYMAGNNETHDAQPTSATNIGGGINMLAASAALNSALPSLLPVIGITPFAFGNAPGQPQVTTVGSPDAMVDLFNSAASKQILSANADASSYEAYYKAFLSLGRAASRPTYQRQLRITKASANFLGKNLASQLMPSSEDLLRYGVDGGTPNKLRDIAYAFITAVKAFKMGLTNSVILPAMRDDPHGAFADMGNLNSTVMTLGKMFEELMVDLQNVTDPACAGKSLADTTVITVHGDTPKDPRDRGGWPDGTPNNSNWLYAYGAGYLKTGWFGGVRAGGGVDGFDPKTGADVPNQPSSATSGAASAAVLYAVTQGDMIAVQQYYNGGSIAGIVKEQII